MLAPGVVLGGSRALESDVVDIRTPRELPSIWGRSVRFRMFKPVRPNLVILVGGIKVSGLSSSDICGHF